MKLDCQVVAVKKNQIPFFLVSLFVTNEVLKQVNIILFYFYNSKIIIFSKEYKHCYKLCWMVFECYL